LLRDYQRRDPELAELDATDEADATARRLLRYFCQPFLITEPFTGHQGE
jgi:F0F1-type ATP synthase beta subunit